jgi:outer membrane protein OmpA-like peptidoglycan-associated protein
MRITTPISLSMLAVLAVTACAPPDPNAYPNDPNARTKTGAIAGALIGGLAGASSVDNDKGRAALLGAAVGAFAGGAIGAGLDQQAADLRAQVGNSGITVTNMGDYLIVNTPSDLLFAVDSASVSSSLYGELQAVANNLNQYPNSTIEVVGHTDNTGTASYNMDLSQRRASSVANILISDGVPGSRVRAYGRGEDQPVASNLDEAGRAQNRRVEIIIRPTN